MSKRGDGCPNYFGHPIDGVQSILESSRLEIWAICVFCFSPVFFSQCGPTCPLNATVRIHYGIQPHAYSTSVPDRSGTGNLAVCALFLS
jgi:hypothetical protein